jgi:RNA polymerase sigma-70 factor (ECF subfamily)
MTIATPSMALPLGVQPPSLAVATATLPPGVAPADDRARRLAAAIARGDETAFRELYDDYQGRLFRLALVLARGDEALAQDAVQAAFIIAARKLRGAESASHLWNWLARVTRQQLVKIWKQRRPKTGFIEVAELPDCPTETPPDAALEECLDAALLTMPPDDRDLIAGFYFDGLSHKEIADRLGATPKAISCRLERLRAKLRSAIARQLSHET